MQSNKKDTPIGKRMLKYNKKQSKHMHFLRTRMWVSVLMSLFHGDHSVVPADIGNDVLFSNNMFITKNGLHSYIVITELSEDTLIAFTSDLIDTVKKKIAGVDINFTYVGKRYHPDVSSDAATHRYSMWKKVLDDKRVGEKTARRCARLVYSYEEMRTGIPVYKVHLFLRFTAPTGKVLADAMQAASSYLDTYGAVYNEIQSNVKFYVRYLTFTSHLKTKNVKDIGYNIFSSQTLAESLPGEQGFNDTIGSMIGMDTGPNWPYMIDWRKHADAKNILVDASTGSGKTFLILTNILDQYVDDYGILIRDIKGTDYAVITESLGGINIPLHQLSTKYPNTFKLRKEDAIDDDCDMYYNRMIKLSRELLYIICKTGKNATDDYDLIDEFLADMYTQLGVLKSNPNTWQRSLTLEPCVIYDYFCAFLSKEVMQKYPQSVTCRNHLKMFFSKNGIYNYMFQEELNPSSILQTSILTFNFGLLDSLRIDDPISFDLHYFFSTIYGDAYIADRKRRGLWTTVINEEAQTVSDYVLQYYSTDCALGRARNQITYTICNDIHKLCTNPIAAPILSGANILLLGAMNDSNQQYFIKEYDIEKYAMYLKQIVDDPEYKNHFLLINRMQAQATTAKIKACVPENISKGEIFKNVDIKKN